MAINLSEKDSALIGLRDSLLNASNVNERLEGENTQLNQSMLYLQQLLGQLHPTNKGEQIVVQDTYNESGEDVIIMHDSLFKHVAEGVTKNENISLKKVWTPHLSDALREITSLIIKPKVIFLHTATNDLPMLTEEEIVGKVIEIQKICTQRGIKFIWSGIIPRGDDPSLSSKGQLVNAMLSYTLGKDDMTFISWNGNFVDDRGVIDKSLYEDETHLNLMNGSRLLAMNTRYSICEAFGKDVTNLKSNANPNNRRRNQRKHNHNNHNT